MNELDPEESRVVGEIVAGIALIGLLALAVWWLR